VTIDMHATVSCILTNKCELYRSLFWVTYLTIFAARPCWMIYIGSVFLNV